jgi:hypothetical protein
MRRKASVKKRGMGSIASLTSTELKEVFSKYRPSTDPAEQLQPQPPATKTEQPSVSPQETDTPTKAAVANTDSNS